MGDLNPRVETLTTNRVSQSNTPTTVALTNGVVIVEGNHARVEPQALMPTSDTWARTVEIFNKIKPKDFSGKSDSTEATRWMDLMKKIFSVLRVSNVEQQKLTVYNLEDSDLEWWKSVSITAEQDVLEWAEFERRFNVMFIPESSKNAKEKELLQLKQGELSVDEYDQKSCTLCHFVVNLDISNKERCCRMFENGLRDEIRTPVVASIHSQYNKCAESALADERYTPKSKTKEVDVKAKVKVEASNDQANAQKP